MELFRPESAWPLYQSPAGCTPGRIQTSDQRRVEIVGQGLSSLLCTGHKDKSRSFDLCPILGRSLETKQGKGRM